MPSLARLKPLTSVLWACGLGVALTTACGGGSGGTAAGGTGGKGGSVAAGTGGAAGMTAGAAGSAVGGASGKGGMLATGSGSAGRGSAGAAAGGKSGAGGSAVAGAAGTGGTGGVAGTGGAGGAAGAGGASTGVVLDGCAGYIAEPIIRPTGQYGHPNGLSAAGDDTCVTFPSGAVACWGADDQGQLGDCSTTPRPSPGIIAGLPGTTDPLLSMSAHRACFVAITGSASGPVLCWGPGPPTLIAGMPPSNGVNVADDHACASTTASANLYCWGDNTYGQLGDGTTNSSTTAVAVVGLPTYIWQNVGSDVTCGWDFKTSSWCWGRNTDGQLGDGTTTSKSVPLQILPGPAINPFPVGRHIFWYDSTPNLFCSGTGACGDGGGPSSVRLKPTQIALSSWARSNPAGSDQATCLILGDFSVACWGSNGHGQLGDGTMVDRFTPAAVLLASGIQGQYIYSTTDGSSFFLITTDYTLYAWGRNDRGQLGDGTTTDRSTPVPVIGIGASLVVAAGASHACAINSELVVQCWGGNSSGQLGDGTFVDRPTPVTVTF